MTDEEKDDAERHEPGSDGDGGNPSESRFSFLTRNDEPNGSGSGSASGDGSGGGTGGDGGGGSDESEERSGVFSLPIENSSQGGIGTVDGENRSAGGDGRGGDGGGGEHVKFSRNCGCGSCRSRRASRGQEEPSEYANANAAETGEKRSRRTTQASVPESVDFSDIFPGMSDGKPLKVDSLFSLAYATLFDAVKLVRKEDFWSLTKEEAGKLGKVSVACLNTIPEASKAKIVKRFDKYLPWVSLLGFGMIITYPRVLAAMQNEEQKRTNRFPSPLPFAGPNSPAETMRSVPLGSERISPDPVRSGSESSAKSSFPPGHGSNFPEFDYKIPS